VRVAAKGASRYCTRGRTIALPALVRSPPSRRIAAFQTACLRRPNVLQIPRTADWDIGDIVSLETGGPIAPERTHPFIHPIAVRRRTPVKILFPQGGVRIDHILIHQIRQSGVIGVNDFPELGDGGFQVALAEETRTGDKVSAPPAHTRQPLYR